MRSAKKNLSSSQCEFPTPLPRAYQQKATHGLRTVSFTLAPYKKKEKEVEINFECQKCKNIFDCEVGRVSIDETTMRPVFKKKLVCPRCGELTMNDVHLTEIGQGQLTEATMNI